MHKTKFEKKKQFSRVPSRGLKSKTKLTSCKRLFNQVGLLKRERNFEVSESKPSRALFQSTTFKNVYPISDTSGLKAKNANTYC